MIQAKITLSDGDEITMPFETWESLALWMEDHVGSYMEVDASPKGDNRNDAN
jgi:hypothetical protein